MKVEQFAAKIDNSIRAMFVPDAPSRRTNNWASDLDHPCKRNLVYARRNWRDRKLIDIDMEYRFKEGRNKELEVRQLLERAGWQIEGVQDYFVWDMYQIAGKIDGFILDEDRIKYPLEVKSVSPWFWDGTRSIEEIRSHKKFWIRKIVAQMNNYLFMTEKEFGILALVTFGKVPRILPMKIDYELGEICVKAAEFVNDCVDRDVLPDRIDYDAGICGLCGFEHICKPVKTSKLGTFEITAEIKQKLNRYFELKPEVKEYDALKKALIGSKSKPGYFHGRNLLVGPDIEIETKEYDMVQKAREERVIPVVKTTISKLDLGG